MRQTILSLLILLFFIQLVNGAEKQKVILDCDLGSGLDDAFAVALILASPEFEVLGLVMTHGNTHKRAQVAGRLLYECGREEIPVVVGKPTPLIVGKDTTIAPDAQQFAWAAGFDKVKPISQNAADFIIENLKRYPNEVILFTAGPLSNIGEVLKKDPGALKRAKRVVSMFGSFYMGYAVGSKPTAEWNVKADVQAARMLLDADVLPLFAGLDVTAFVKLNEQNRMRLLYRNSPLTDALCALYSLWLYESYAHVDPAMFDPVAIGLVLWPELFATRKVHVSIDRQGRTLVDETKPPNCEIAVHIQSEELIRRLMERLLKQNLRRQ
ncbi:Inosine/uridine-preferring nucleoside hydrolase [Caldithrix abyssi DSM 13497]|uniref:Inosine-uridine nucleoside N-ribohydrolase n=1 Tax=Caldithrix abyssi DSM 13497 TaxID=880073 RepID=H1XYA5_CALAY|nr:nucleoside hydrolase [Caldithrix abyssi]APF19265.1 Inosine-uridine nucleoside N-ribohydrolase [Caldithrix abyssi DSM 13497]EHO43172.1 Inosine/uridine-preferring nucleoside hydrolase [Caldithrix abyssi DSM 13497]